MWEQALAAAPVKKIPVYHARTHGLQGFDPVPADFQDYALPHPALFETGNAHGRARIASFEPTIAELAPAVHSGLTFALHTTAAFQCDPTLGVGRSLTALVSVQQAVAFGRGRVLRMGKKPGYRAMCPESDWRG